VVIAALVFGAGAALALIEWTRLLEKPMAAPAVADIPAPASTRPPNPAPKAPRPVPGPQFVAIQPPPQVRTVEVAPNLADTRKACWQRLVSAEAANGVEVIARGEEILFKSPRAGGMMAQEFLKHGAFQSLAGPNCAFRYVTFVDGRYFSATWGLPPSASDEQQIGIIAERERKQATAEELVRKRDEAWGRLLTVIDKSAQEGREIAECRSQYSDNAVAFEVCRQGAINRARKP